jgi:hypothetical protein
MANESTLAIDRPDLDIDTFRHYPDSDFPGLVTNNPGDIDASPLAHIQYFYARIRAQYALRQLGIGAQFDSHIGHLFEIDSRGTTV